MIGRTGYITHARFAELWENPEGDGFDMTRVPDSYIFSLSAQGENCSLIPDMVFVIHYTGNTECRGDRLVDAFQIVGGVIWIVLIVIVLYLFGSCYLGRCIY